MANLVKVNTVFAYRKTAITGLDTPGRNTYLLLSVQQKVATQNLMTNELGDDTIDNLINDQVMILLAILQQRLI